MRPGYPRTASSRLSTLSNRCPSSRSHCHHSLPLSHSSRGNCVAACALRRAYQELVGVRLTRSTAARYQTRNDVRRKRRYSVATVRNLKSAALDLGTPPRINAETGGQSRLDCVRARLADGAASLRRKSFTSSVAGVTFSIVVCRRRAFSCSSLPLSHSKLA